MNRLMLGLLFCALGGCAASGGAKPEPAPVGDPNMQLGNFSVSLTVKDIAASRAFYEALGFRVKTNMGQGNWMVLQNGSTTIGLFQGMFDRNMLTFNPGWDSAAQPLPSFKDVREIQADLLAKGIKPTLTTDAAGTDTGFIMLADPDGNPILIDQHVPAPKK